MAIKNIIRISSQNYCSKNNVYPICEGAKKNKGYEWIFKPNDDFWEIQYTHYGNYIAVRNINKWGICDLNGNIVQEFQYEYLAPYGDGTFILGSDTEKEHMIIIDVKGKTVKTFKYNNYIFLDKTNIAYLGNDNFLVDENDLTISLKYSDMYGIGKKKIAFQKGGVYGVMDYNGKILVQPKYSAIMSFSENKAAVKTGGKWFFIDSTFKQVVPPFVSEKMEFYYKNGLVPFKVNGKVGYLDDKGIIAIPAKFEQGGVFGGNGLAPVTLDKKFGYINTKGEVVIPLEYEHAMPFENGLGAIAKLINYAYMYAIVDVNGKIITDFEFTQLYFLPNGIVKAKFDGRWGMLKIETH